MEALRVYRELYWTKAIALFLQQTQGEDVFMGRERQLWDKSRVDILTRKFAIEVDWAKKQAEAIGQSLWYAMNFDRKPCIILLIEDFKKESKYVYICKAVCVAQGIQLWLVDTAKAMIDVNGDRFPLPRPSVSTRMSSLCAPTQWAES